MKIQISKRFTKDAQKISDAKILAKIRKVLEQAKAVNSIVEITGIEEMSGYQNFLSHQI